MDLLATYLLVCVIPLLLAWATIVGVPVLIIVLSDWLARPTDTPPIGGREQALKSRKALAAEQSQRA